MRQESPLIQTGHKYAKNVQYLKFRSETCSHRTFLIYVTLLLNPPPREEDLLSTYGLKYKVFRIAKVKISQSWQILSYF